VSLSNILLIPGVGGDLQELRGLLFGNGQAGWMGFPSLDNTAIAANTLGSGVQTFRDLYLGNNGTQGTADQRSAWGRVPKSGRRNNFIWTSDLTNAAWTKTRTTAPAFNQIRETATSGIHAVTQSVVSAGAAEVFSVTAKTDGRTKIVLVNLARNSSDATFDIVNGTVTNQNTNASASISNLGDGWFRCSVAVTTTTAGTATREVWLVNESDATSYLGDITKGAFLTDFQIGPAGNYQSVRSAFDITEPGQTNCYYLQPDGLDDGYATPSIDFTGTDKITVFASLRKLSDAAIGQVVSNVNITTTGTGAFALLAPSGATTNARWQARELTGGAQQIASATIAANNNFIVTGQTDGNANNHSIRLNGSLIQTATGDLGTGNFRAGALQLLRNNLQPDSPFNGQCFALIVAGGSYSTATIQRVEQILSKYTPGVTL
jgi:hypothetical protein